MGALGAVLLAFFAPWVYLLGVLTSYIPTYIFLFSKAVDKADEEEENFILSKGKLPHETLSTYLGRKLLMAGSWALLCVFLWWAFLLISMSKTATNKFIEGFAGAME